MLSLGFDHSSVSPWANPVSFCSLAQVLKPQPFYNKQLHSNLHVKMYSPDISKCQFECQIEESRC